MKRFLFACVVLLSSLLLLGQNPDGNYNPYVNAGTISPSPLHPLQVNGTGRISFNFGNSGNDPLDIYTNQFVMLTLTLSNGEPDNADPLAAIGGTASGYFTWSYNAGTYTADQTTPIPASFSGTITIYYRVTQNTGFPGSNGFNVNITPGVYQTNSNSEDDDAVSSYTYTEIRDYGDAPVSYGTADHIMDFSRRMGSLVDGEDASQPTANADWDDINGDDDEDGVSFPAEMHREETVDISVTNAGMGYLNAWFDWDGDGDFMDAGERVADNVQRLSGIENLQVTIPANAIISSAAYARFRFSADSVFSPTGTANGGEVEDYQVTLLCAPPVPTLTASDTSFCSGTSIIITAGGGTNYLFRVDGVTAQDGTLVTYVTDSLSDGQVVESNAAPENLCPDLTVDLTGLITSEAPAGGSALYKTENDPVGEDIPDATTADAGTYYLFYQDAEGCYSSGTEVIVTINACPPDLTPVLQASPNIMHGVTGFNLLVEVTELNLENSSGTITINIPKDPRWILTDGFVTSLASLGSTDLDNSDWSYSEDAVNHIFTSTVSISAGDFSTFGFRVTFDPGSTRGLYTITAQLVSGSGGEVRVGNNSDSEKLDYFQG